MSSNQAGINTFTNGISPDVAAVLAEELLKKGLAVRMKVTGPSMSPTVESGDTVILRPVRRLRIGDIVFYRTGTGHAVLHRIVRIDRNAEGDHLFFTMGDALSTLEGPFPAHAVMGRAVAIEPMNDTRQSLTLVSPTTRIGAYLKAYLLQFRLALVFVRKLAAALVRRAVRTAD